MNDSSNPPRQIVDGSLLSGGATWLYESLDPYSAVQAPNYFGNGGIVGLKRGDIMIVRCTATGEVTTHSVLYVIPSTKSWDPTPGAASLSQIMAPGLMIVLTAGANADLDPAPVAMDTIATLDLSPSSGNSTVSGLAAGVAGQVVVTSNDDAANSVTLLGNNSATPANRFTTDIVIPAGGTQLIVYQGSRWTPLFPA